eukprot:TRINITY_DN11694_c0_g1_i2.p1 TRINITY_DN11694_c0_g1~~TRINITY_DN11694_c0_g1_i2.p1  ORF type:complete len:1469 (+),score=292.34 TRINITY_DN11694_c0_g1_i2:532-4407(+)
MSCYWDGANLWWASGSDPTYMNTGSWEAICGSTSAPTVSPTQRPSVDPSRGPSRQPSVPPSIAPSAPPTVMPTASPSTPPTGGPTVPPTTRPSVAPSVPPSAAPSMSPTGTPSRLPTSLPTKGPSVAPTSVPSVGPSVGPSRIPSVSPSGHPTKAPSLSPSGGPSRRPSTAPTAAPLSPTRAPSVSPQMAPSIAPTANPSASPTVPPSTSPNPPPTKAPLPQLSPTQSPIIPTASPSKAPSLPPSRRPSASPSRPPAAAPTTSPANGPTAAPSLRPSAPPSRPPTAAPTTSPAGGPTVAPTLQPSGSPARGPTAPPTGAPSGSPARGPTGGPTPSPSASPRSAPTKAPLTAHAPTQSPLLPTAPPTRTPSVPPTLHPSAAPQRNPTRAPSATPVVGVSPTAAPTAPPTALPTAGPQLPPTKAPLPASSPTQAPLRPTASPSAAPTAPPSKGPATAAPSVAPSLTPQAAPTAPPSSAPLASPTPGPLMPSQSPAVPSSAGPSPRPSVAPSALPTAGPRAGPSLSPTPGPLHPSAGPSTPPSSAPSAAPSTLPRPPTRIPSASPTYSPTAQPSRPPAPIPSVPPAAAPTRQPTLTPNTAPVAAPSAAPTPEPTEREVVAIVAMDTGEVSESAAILVGSGPAAAQAGRLVVLLEGCVSDEVPDELPQIPLHLTQVKVNGFVLPMHAGCVLANAAIIAGCAVLQLLAAEVLRLLLRKPRTWCRGAVRYPSGTFIVAIVMTQGSTLAGARLIRNAEAPMDWLLGVAAVLSGVLLPFHMLRKGRDARALSFYKLERQPGLARYWLGPGEWLSSPEPEQYVERWGVAFRAALPGHAVLLPLDVAIAQVAMIAAGFLAKSCWACGIGRLLDCLLCGLLVEEVCRRQQPYSRPFRTPLTVLAQVFVGAGALLLAAGFFSSACKSGERPLAGHDAAGPVLLCGAGLMLCVAIVDATAILRSMQTRRREVLDAALSRLVSLANRGVITDMAGLREHYEREMNTRFSQYDFDAVVSASAAVGGGVSLHVLIAAETDVWGRLAKLSQKPTPPPAHADSPLASMLLLPEPHTSAEEASDGGPAPDGSLSTPARSPAQPLRMVTARRRRVRRLPLSESVGSLRLTTASVDEEDLAAVQVSGLAVSTKRSYPGSARRQPELVLQKSMTEGSMTGAPSMHAATERSDGTAKGSSVTLRSRVSFAAQALVGADSAAAEQPSVPQFRRVVRPSASSVTLPGSKSQMAARGSSKQQDGDGEGSNPLRRTESVPGTPPRVRRRPPRLSSRTQSTASSTRDDAVRSVSALSLW